MFEDNAQTDPTSWWERRMSLAACRERFDIAPTTDPEQFGGLVVAIERKMEPSYAIYRDTMTRGPTPEIRLLGAYGLGMAHRDTIVRARTAALITNVYGGTTYGLAPDPYRMRSAALEPWLAPHRDAATAAFTEVLRLAGQYPDVARENSVLTFATANARNELHDLSSDFPREL